MIGASGSLWNMFRLYIGSGWLMMAFIAALVFLFFVEKDKNIKCILIYVSLLVFGIFFFPVSKYLVINVLKEEETYYRVLWWLPLGIVLPYSVIKLMLLHKKKWVQAVLFVLSAVVLCWGGTLVYRSPVFSKAENVYQVPNSVKDICDFIEVDGREVMAIFPDEMVPYVRQYTSYVLMPYGYGSVMARWNLYNDLHELVKVETIDTPKLVEKMRERGCQYLIVHVTKAFSEDMSAYDFTKVAEFDGYAVYRDNTAYLGL